MSTQIINNYLYLISMSDMASVIDISSNIDAARINTCIKNAQDLDLSLFMGDAFWYDFNNQFEGNGGISGVTSSGITSAANGVYPLLSVIGGSGTLAMVSVTIFNKAISNISVVTPGINYNVGDLFTCAEIPGITFSILSLAADFKPGTSQLYQDFFNGCVYNDTNGHPVQYQGIKPALVYWTFARFTQIDQIRYTTTGPVGKRHDNADPATPKQLAQIVEMQRSEANAYCNKIEKFLHINRQYFTLWRMSEGNKNSRQPGPRIRAIDRTRYNTASFGYGRGYDDLGNIIW